MFAHGESVTFLRAQTVTDAYGNTVADWSLTPTSTAVDGVGVEPRPTAEPFQASRNAVTSGFTIYADGRDLSVLVGPADRVEVRGFVDEVDGEVAVWSNPYTGRLAGTIVQTKLVTG